MVSSHEVVLHIILGCLYLIFLHSLTLVNWSPKSDSKWSWDSILKFVAFAWDIIVLGLTIDYVATGTLATGLIFAYNRHAAIFLGGATLFNWIIIGVKKNADTTDKDVLRARAPEDLKMSTSVYSYENENIDFIIKADQDITVLTSSPAALAVWGFLLFMVLMDMSVELNMYTTTYGGQASHKWNIISVFTCSAAFASTGVLFFMKYMGACYAFTRDHYKPFAGLGHHDLLKKTDDEPLALYTGIGSERVTMADETRIDDESQTQPRSIWDLTKPSAWVMSDITSNVLFFLLPWPAILSLNFCFTSMMMDFFNDYGRMFYWITVCLYYPFMMCALHNTFAVWADHFIFATKVFFQLFFMFAAVLTRVPGSTTNLAPTGHLQFTTNWANTALIYRTDPDDSTFTFTIRYTLAIMGLLYLATSIVMLFASSTIPQIKSGDFFSMAQTFRNPQQVFGKLNKLMRGRGNF